MQANNEQSQIIYQEKTKYCFNIRTEQMVIKPGNKL